MSTFSGLFATKGDVRQAKVLALKKLARLGISDTFTVKLRQTTDSAHWVAQYRSNSQFRSGPIFWVSPNHPNDLGELTKSLLHEYGHVIYELARNRSSTLLDDIDTAFMDDEEEFAESFGRAVYAEKDYPWLSRIVRGYLAALTGASAP